MIGCLCSTMARVVQKFRQEYMITNEFDYHSFKNSIDKLFQKE